MTEQLAIQSKLRVHYLELQKKNPSFSLRAFARKLDLNPSALSEILNGKRRISKNLASRVLFRMGLDPKEQHKILSLFPKAKTSASPHLGPNLEDSSGLCSDNNITELTADQFHLIGSWYHFAILSLAETTDFKADPLWVAKRLGIKVPEAEAALERLQRLGLAEWSRRTKTLKLTHAQLSTTDEVRSQAVRQSHHDDLRLCARAIDETDINERDFTSLTLAIDLSKLNEAKKMIRDFQQKLCAYLEVGPQTEVYKFCFHVLPLSKKLGDK